MALKKTTRAGCGSVLVLFGSIGFQVCFCTADAKSKQSNYKSQVKFVSIIRNPDKGKTLKGDELIP
jgi:hypothetical protein